MFAEADPPHNYPLEDWNAEDGDVHVRVRVVRDPGAWRGTGHVRGRWARVCHVSPGPVDGGKRRERRAHVSQGLQLAALTSACFG